MLIPNRHESSDKYRYGFQGQEKDDEIKGEGNAINYKFRMHDPSVGRFFAVDPLEKKFPHNSPYAFSENRVIDGVEFEGLEVLLVGNIVTVSAGGSFTVEGGVIFDFSNGKVEMYEYSARGWGYETNISVADEFTVTYYATASHLDVSGLGMVMGVNAGEGLVGSTNIATSGEYTGNNFSIGVGVGVLPISVSYYDTETTIGKPINNAAKIGNINRMIDAVKVGFNAELSKIYERSSQLNEGIGKVSQEISKIDEKLKSTHNNKERSELIIDRTMYYETRLDYYKENDELGSKAKDLKEKITKLEELRDNKIKEINE